MSLSHLLQVEHSLQYQTASMTRRGLLCDVKETKRQIAVLDSGIESATSRLEDIGIPASSTTDAGRIALEEFLLSENCNVERTPKSGKLKVGADSLRMAVLESDDTAKEVVEDLVFIKQAVKVKAAYLNAFLLAAEADGRVHPAIKTMGARTHRMSISEPPLQQIPRDPMQVDGQTADTRGCLVADPGCLLVSADYAQIEQRVYATLAGEKDLCEAFIKGTDLHKVVATQLFGGSIEDVTPEQRQIAKTAGYLMIYGGGGRKLSISAGIPVPKAVSIVKAMKKAQSHGVSYAKSLAEQSAVTTPFGRVLPIDEARRYAALNYMVQSSARDLFVIGGVSIIKAGYGQWLWLPVHDEWILNVPEDQAERVAKELGEIMFIDFYGTPIEAEGKVLGKRWHKG